MNIVANCLFATVVLLSANASVAVIVAAMDTKSPVLAGILMSEMFARNTATNRVAASRVAVPQTAVSMVMKVAAVVAAAIHVFATPLQRRISPAAAALVH